MMNNDRIRSLFGLSGGPRGAAQNMVATAFEDGSDDNISVAIAEWGEVTRERQMGTMPIEFVPPAAAAPVAVQASGPLMGLILGIGVVIIAIAEAGPLGGVAVHPQGFNTTAAAPPITTNRTATRAGLLLALAATPLARAVVTTVRSSIAPASSVIVVSTDSYLSSTTRTLRVGPLCSQNGRAASAYQRPGQGAP